MLLEPNQMRISTSYCYAKIPLKIFNSKTAKVLRLLADLIFSNIFQISNCLQRRVENTAVSKIANFLNDEKT